MNIKQFHMKYLWALIHPEMFLLPYGKKPEEKYSITFYTRTGAAELTEDGDYVFSNRVSSLLRTIMVITNEDETKIWRSSSANYYKTVQLPAGKYKVKIIGGYNSTAGFYLDNQWIFFEVKKVDGKVKIETPDYGQFVTTSGSYINLYMPVVMIKAHIFPSEEAPNVYTCEVSGTSRSRLGVYTEGGGVIPTSLHPVLKKTEVSPYGTIKMSIDYILLTHTGNEHIDFGEHVWYNDYTAVANVSGPLGDAPSDLPGGYTDLTYLSSTPLYCDVSYTLNGVVWCAHDGYNDVFDSWEENNENSRYTVTGSARFRWGVYRSGDSTFAVNVFAGARAVYPLVPLTTNDIDRLTTVITETFSNTFNGYLGNFKKNEIDPPALLNYDAPWSASNVLNTGLNGITENIIRSDNWWALFESTSTPDYYNKYYKNIKRPVPNINIYNIVSSGMYNKYLQVDKEVYSQYWSTIYRGLVKFYSKFKSINHTEGFGLPPKGTVYFDISGTCFQRLENILSGSPDNTRIEDLLTQYVNSSEGAISDFEVDVRPTNYTAEILVTKYDAITNFFFERILVNPNSMSASTSKMIIQNGNAYPTVTSLCDPIAANEFWYYMGASIPKSHTTPDYDYWMSVPAESI